MFGKGISKGSCIIDLGVEYGVVEKSGAWFSYNGAKIAQGREKAVEYFESDQQVQEEARNKILQAFYNKDQASGKDKK